MGSRFKPFIFFLAGVVCCRVGIFLYGNCVSDVTLISARQERSDGDYVSKIDKGDRLSGLRAGQEPEVADKFKSEPDLVSIPPPAASSRQRRPPIEPIQSSNRFSGGRMTPAEYRAIADEVSKRGPSVKLLVFGIGHGSAAISRMNPTGTTVFAEDRVDWVNWATLLGWTVIKPSYWTSTAIHARQANLTASPSLIIPELRSVKVGRADPITLWDVIVIDGPDVGKQGRFQPLATAADRISANGVVFVHDCSDTVVRQWSVAHFGAPTAMISDELCVFSAQGKQPVGNAAEAAAISELIVPSYPEVIDKGHPPVSKDPLAEAARADFFKFAGTSGSMVISEYSLITDDLMSRGPCNLLIFSCGRDSPVWNRVNAGGLTVFVENNAVWAQNVTKSCPDCVIDIVQYWTNLDKQGGDFRLAGSPELLLPNFRQRMQSLGFKGTVWDVIIVDAPEGWDKSTPGRMQSIATAAQYSDASTTVYVHDCDRTGERMWGTAYFGPEMERFANTCIFRYGPAVQAISNANS